MTDLESPRKNNDCYFYYYSTCAKGDSCTFRHEPSALGCETMCSFWKEGKCVNVHCNFRHMELRKNRKVIQCYWESQPGGCLKPHCPFMHQTAKPSSADESLESKTDSGTESADNTMHEKLNQMSESFKKAPVDSLVVNFEEESDNESGPANSPVKASHRVVKVKTLEEIKLEKIQAESAAYYSFPEVEKYSVQSPHDADDLRRRILDRFTTKGETNPKKRGFETNLDGLVEQSTRFKKLKTDSKDVNDIKIKTLDEIRAERAKKFEENSNRTIDVCDSSVTSTCDIVTETDQTKESRPKRKVKLQRKPAYFERRNDVEEKKEERELVEAVADEKIVDSAEERLREQDKSPVGSESSKTIDEVLLLQDDDDSSNVSLKGEDELLNDSDDDMLGN